MACDPQTVITAASPIIGRVPPGIGPIVGGGKIKVITGKGGSIGFDPTLCQPEIDGAFVVEGGGDKFDCYADKEGGDAGRLPSSAGVGFASGWRSSDGTKANGDTFNTYADGDGSTQTLNAGTGLLSAWIEGPGDPVIEGDFRFIRLLISAVNGVENFGGVIEFELREEFGGASVAVGGTASASATEDPFEASRSFDGLFDVGDGWIYPITTFPEWLQYDFGVGVTRRIVQYRVGSYSGTINTATRSSRDWILQGSNNGSDWTNLHQVAGQSGWVFPEMRTFPL